MTIEKFPISPAPISFYLLYLHLGVKIGGSATEGGSESCRMSDAVFASCGVSLASSQSLADMSAPTPSDFSMDFIPDKTPDCPYWFRISGGLLLSL